MLFSSMTFIFLFLPIVMISYFLVSPKLKNYVLLVASLVFYALGELRYLVIMLLIIVVNYLGAIGMSYCHKQVHKKMILGVTIGSNLSVLFYFKYFNFFIENIKQLFHLEIDTIDVIMPIGISFYTFQAMSYVIDVYRHDCRVQSNIMKLSLYISLFPQLIAGPIIKYHDIEKDIEKRQETFNKVVYGIKRFIIGLAKKVLIANTLGVIVDKIFEQSVENFSATISWLGAIAYSFQLFYDFSGYSDMAIGLGYIFGFKFLENFNYPYISKSITEFWRRWHISLSTWFKQYLYIPLGGNRLSKMRTCLNLFIVFLATGFWHGASWNFIFWGLWHGFFIIMEKTIAFPEKLKSIYGKIGQHIYCLLVIIIGWVMFRADNMNYALQYLENMFGLLENHQEYKLMYYIDTIEITTLIVATICATPIFSRILEIKPQHTILRAINNIWLLILFILSATEIATSSYNPFIYFRF